MYNIRLTLWYILLIALQACAQRKQNSSGPETGRSVLLFEENFGQPLDTAIWKVELQASIGSKVETAENSLHLQTGEGVTVWLNKQLHGNIRITYNRKVIIENEPFDRLSDLNQFWMATDPKNSNLFTRSGKLEEYDKLQLYYVGMGGNTNKTTRFRRYDGKGNRELIAEYSDSAHLLKPNHTYSIKIENDNGKVSYWVDNQLYFSYIDQSPLTQGYFGFRSTKSNQQISHLKIYQLK